MPFFIYCTKNLFRNMDIHQTAKIKILQKITKSSTVFTNMMLHSWKKNFEHKFRYREQCFTLKVWWILLFKEVLFLKCHFFLLHRCVQKWLFAKYCPHFSFITLVTVLYVIAIYMGNTVAAVLSAGVVVNFENFFRSK